MHDTIKLNTGVKMIAHRGVSALERENSIAAFVAAGNRSHYGIETDVHVTKDGQFIVIHDDSTQRVTGVEGIVEEMTFDQLRTLRLFDMDGSPRSDLTLPSLAEYIRVCKKYEKQSILELKNHMEPEHIAGIVETIRAEGWLERTTFIAFDLPNMLCLRSMLPNQSLQYLVNDITDGLLDTLVQNKLDLDIRFPNLTREFLDTCHANGILVNVWTVDSIDNALRLAEWGVDFMTSNGLE